MPPFIRPSIASIEGARTRILFNLCRNLSPSPVQHGIVQRCSFAEVMRSFASSHLHIAALQLCAGEGSFVVAPLLPPPFCARLTRPPCFCGALLLASAASSLPLPLPHPGSAAPNANGHIDHSQVCLPTQPPCRQALLLSLENEGFRQVAGKSCSGICAVQNL